MARDYSAQICALEDAIASGATSITYDGQTVRYDSLSEMFRRLQFLQKNTIGASTVSKKPRISSLSATLRGQ